MPASIPSKTYSANRIPDSVRRVGAERFKDRTLVDALRFCQRDRAHQDQDPTQHNERADERDRDDEVVDQLLDRFDNVGDVKYLNIREPVDDLSLEPLSIGRRRMFEHRCGKRLRCVVEHARLKYEYKCRSRICEGRSCGYLQHVP